MPHVAFLEFPVFPDGYPLASGYLQTYAYQEAVIADAYTFEIHSIPLKTQNLKSRVMAVRADIYAFSCYVWNTALVRRLLPELVATNPNAQFILGGPQVMRKASDYLSPTLENVVLCNGEGERTFANYLRALLDEAPDLAQVKGLSFYRDGHLHTTEVEPRIRAIDEVPSPYLTEVFDAGKYTWAPVETNRGCPFQCTYCFWGAATQAKVHRFDRDRVFRELDWLSRNRALFVLFIDANFGMYERDVEIARHLAHCKQTYGFPLTVGFSSSKNTPERVMEITQIFQDAGLIATQPISLQTMDSQALKAVRRNNIKTDTYIQLQTSLNRRRTSSFIELIWPLPGETLETFKAGIETLCATEADTFLIYPLLVINNVELSEQRDTYGIRTVRDPDEDSEAEIVVATRDVSTQQFVDGLRFGYHVIGLYTIRGLRHLGKSLHDAGTMSWSELLTNFGTYCRTAHRTHGYTLLVEDSLAILEAGEPGNFFESDAALLHLALYSQRAEVDQLLADFVNAMGWHAPEQRALFELDLLMRPYLYLQPHPAALGVACGVLRETEMDAQGRTVWVPPQLRDRVHATLGLEGASQAHLRIEYFSSQLPYMAGQGLNVAYCQDRHRRVRSLLPSASWLGPSELEAEHVPLDVGREDMFI